jgi:hypothetical protein
VNIKERWQLQAGNYPGEAIIVADDGATYAMDSGRARRLVKLWNSYVGVVDRLIPDKARGKREQRD